MTDYFLRKKVVFEDMDRAIAAAITGITKSAIGLGNVDNTSDVNKPVSTAQQTALDLKANIASPTFTGTVGGITKSMVGLGSAGDGASVVLSTQYQSRTMVTNGTDTHIISGYL